MISITEEVRDALEKRATKGGRNVSEEIARLVMNAPEDCSAQDAIKLERDRIASARAVERELRIMKGLFNSLFVGFLSLKDTHFTDPEKEKHPILAEAEKASWVHIKEEQTRNSSF